VEQSLHNSQQALQKKDTEISQLQAKVEQLLIKQKEMGNLLSAQQ
jgi:hypothetical protein